MTDFMHRDELGHTISVQSLTTSVGESQEVDITPV